MKRTLPALFTLLFLLMSGICFAQTTINLPVRGTQGGACHTLSNCAVTVGNIVNGEPAAWFDFTWLQFVPVYPLPGLFCTHITAVNPTGNPFTVTCKDNSPTDGTSYTLSLSESWVYSPHNPPCGRFGCYYAVTGGNLAITASDATLHAMGLD